MSNYKISLIVPTRDRVDSLVRMMDSVMNNAENPALIEFVLYIDKDDVSQYPDFKSNVKIIRGDRVSMSVMNNLCCENARGNILFLCNDDVVVKTNKWDSIIYNSVESYTDDVYLLYPNDLHKGERLCTFPVFSKQLFLNFPGIMPKFYKGAFIDTHIFDIFQQLSGLGENRIKYLPNVIFEHFHFLTGKSVIDSTYTDRNRFGDDYMFIYSAKFRSEVSKSIEYYIYNGHVKSKAAQPTVQPTVNYTYTNSNFSKSIVGIFSLYFSSNARFYWKSKLSIYMLLRKIYNLFKN